METATISNLPVDYQAELAKQAELIHSRVSAPSGDQIRITQNKKIVFPDGIELDGSRETFRAVIVDFVARNEFYEDGFDKDNITPPNCMAIGLEPTMLVPAIGVPDKQAETCSSCPNNQWGSGPRGKGKACKNTRVLAVMRPGAEAGAPLWLLKVSPTGTQHFDKYVTHIANMLRTSPIGVITEFALDPSLDYPSLRFGNPIKNDEIGTYFERQGEARKRLETLPDFEAVKADKSRGGARRK